MKVDIIVDTICPWCYVGKKRFERALALRPQADLEVGWRAFQLNPEMPPGGMDRREYIERKFGGSERARRIHNGIARIGKEEGIYFLFSMIKTIPNTLDSHRLVRFAAERDLQTPVVGALFDAYFTKGCDIGDKRELAGIGRRAGLDHGEALEYLESGRDLDKIAAEDRLARRLGVNGVPSFIFDRKYAISGVQSPEVFVQIFDLANRDAAERPDRSSGA